MHSSKRRVRILRRNERSGTRCGTAPIFSKPSPGTNSGTSMPWKIPRGQLSSPRGPRKDRGCMFVRGESFGSGNLSTDCRHVPLTNLRPPRDGLDQAWVTGPKNIRSSRAVKFHARSNLSTCPCRRRRNAKRDAPTNENDSYKDW